MIRNLLLMLSGMLFLSVSVHSQWGTEVGENVQLTSGEGLKINVLSDPAPENGWYVSYTVLSGVNKHVVHLARVDSVGEILWDKTIHDLSEVGNTRAKMISDMEGGVILAWIDRRDPDNPLIYANRIDPDGNKLWGESDLQISSTDDEEGCPKMISNGSGGAIITMNDGAPGDGGFPGIYAHGVSSNGAVMWETYLFPNGFDCTNYSISPDGSGGLVAFTVYGHVLEVENQVRGMRLDENGNKVWADETIDIGTISQPIGKNFQGSQDGYHRPRVAYHADAGIYLVYFHTPFGGESSVHRGQLIDPDGNKLWDADDLVLNDPSTNSSDVNVLTDLDGNLYFNYHSDTHWKLQKVGADGTLPWTIDGINYSSDPSGWPDKLALTTCNDIMILVDGLDDIIYAVRIDESGEMIYNPAHLALSVDEIGDNHRDPVIAVNENDLVLAVWADDEDVNDSEYQLKMHGFHKTGLLGNTSSLHSFDSMDLSIFPNPVLRGGHFVIESSELDFGMVSIIDSRGKLILNERVNTMNGPVRFTLPDDLNPGMFFLRISQGNRYFATKLLVR